MPNDENPVVRKAGEQSSIWITFFYNDLKYYGKIFAKDFVKIGIGPVRVFVPFYLKSAEGQEATYRLVLDPASYSEPFQWFNTMLWVSWQKMDSSHNAELNSIVEKFKQ